MHRKILIALAGALTITFATTALALPETKAECDGVGGTWVTNGDAGFCYTNLGRAPIEGEGVELEAAGHQPGSLRHRGSSHTHGAASWRSEAIGNGEIGDEESTSHQPGSLRHRRASHTHGANSWRSATIGDGEIGDEDARSHQRGSRFHDDTSSAHRGNSRSSAVEGDEWEDAHGPNSALEDITPDVAAIGRNWTDWLNRDTPGGTGDFESLSNFVTSHGVCAQPVQVQCRRRSDQADWSTTGQDYTCNTTVGGICRNDGQTCQDYEVRFSCP